MQLFPQILLHTGRAMENADHIDYAVPMDEETKRFAELLRNPKLPCPYLIWSSKVFQNYSTCP